MGYYTYYGLYIKEKDEKEFHRGEEYQEFSDFIENIKKGNLFNEIILDDDPRKEEIERLKNLEIVKYFQHILNESSKWYEHDEEMSLISTYFPNKIFKLIGSGEENLDEWINFYFNGKINSYRIIQEYQIESAEFDINLTGGEVIC